MRPMEINDLHYFTEIADAGSFSHGRVRRTGGIANPCAPIIGRRPIKCSIIAALRGSLGFGLRPAD